MRAFDNIYINGKWVASAGSGTLEVTNSATEEVIATVPNGAAADVDAAVAAAKAAFPAWSELPKEERAAYLMKIHAGLEARTDEIAQTIAQEVGMPLMLSKMIQAGLPKANFAIAAQLLGSYEFESQVGNSLVVREPIGVVGCITPWNYPLHQIAAKVAYAIAAGCTVVLKPDIKTPLSALALAALAERAGFPAGVFNVVTGHHTEIGAEMTSNPMIRKLTFTGSTKTGKLLIKQCADTVKKVSMELGGNAPFIVFDDADLAAAVDGAMASKYRNSGQTCVCANRVLVQDGIYDAFAEAFAKRVAALVVGNGLDEGVQQGPLIDKNAVAKVEAHLADAVAKGAKVLVGGNRHKLGGTFFEPTVLGGAQPSMILAREETFGPVAPLFRFNTEAEAIQMANDTEFGLAAYFYAKDSARIHRVSEALEYGIVGVNTGIISTEVAPFGGVKESGIGREGSRHGIDEFLEMKYVCEGGL